ncbi:MAG TPA: C45 family peptidase [Candidatus Avamphibacillus sp.]|nr:C45 family peptidase [Candidatus Avamphibacillus sp.]
MFNFTVDILQIRDSSFNIGFKMGKYVKDKPFLKTFESITKPEIDDKNMKAIYSTFAPHLLEEIDGLAEGLGISHRKAAALFSGYDMPKAEALGCSAMMTKKYYVRNYDFSPDLYDGLFSLIQPDTSFATAGYNLQILGRHDGVNQEGLVAGLHFVSNHGYKKGLSAWTAVRIVLDSCATTSEAVNLLKEIPHAACYNFSLGDKNGDMAVVEASPDKVIVRRGVSALSCVNHFQSEQLKNKNRSSIEHSVKRHHYLEKLKDEEHSYVEIFENFKSIYSPLFFTDYDDLFGTLHTFSYSYHEARILTAIARGEQVLDINFQDWVDGENMDMDILEGIIEEIHK